MAFTETVGARAKDGCVTVSTMVLVLVWKTLQLFSGSVWRVGPARLLLVLQRLTALLPGAKLLQPQPCSSPTDNARAVPHGRRRFVMDNAFEEHRRGAHLVNLS